MRHILQANKLAPGWLSGFEGIKVLSLDCFDTLLWRKVAAPADVFFALAATELFRRHGVSASMRILAEESARRKNRLRKGSYEVTLDDIYREALPGADGAVIAALAACELACEADYCFIFKPVFELIAEARKLGLKVVIVSDTYLTERQLKELLYGAMPALDGMLDAVFCSSAFGTSKSGGIWRHLLPLLRVNPAQVLHLGDNELADVTSPLEFGIQAAHLVHHDPDLGRMLDSRVQLAAQLLPELRYSAPVPSYFHAQFAAGIPAAELERFGYTSIGPVMHAFAEFVLHRRKMLLDEGHQVKIGFLLRDGYLPARACATLAGAPVGCNLNISRFTAIAATLDSRERVLALLAKKLSRAAFEPLTRQLLLPSDLAAGILKKAEQAEQPEMVFSELVLARDTLKIILAASRAMRKRLVAHVQSMTGVAPGDTLMFVDLGYAGTAQTLLTEVLKQDLDVDLVGTYLIAEHAGPPSERRVGLIDSARTDPRVVRALTGSHIAVFEMLCTQDAPSTVDYTPAGEPIFSARALDAGQHASVAAVQAGCLDLIGDMRDLAGPYKPSWNEAEIAHQAGIDLARLLYFPARSELACLAGFQFDFNLGTDMTLDLFDPERGLAGMRRKGLAYVDVGLDETRTNYGMELRQLDLSLASLYFTQNRFGVALETANASYRTETLTAVFASARGQLREEISASATFDGYFSLTLPLSATFDVGVLFGQAYSWLQIESIHLAGNSRHDSDIEMTPGQALVFDQMVAQDNGLFRVAENGMMFVPRRPEYGQGQVCRVIFRPIARAAAQAAMPPGAAAPAVAAAAAPAAEKFAGFHDICVMSCYGAADPGIAAFLNGLNRALAARGICLLLLTTQANPHLEALAIEIPYLLSGFDQVLDDSAGTRPFHPLRATLLSEETQAEHQQDSAVVRRGIAKCEAFYAALGNTVAPCAGLLWNTTLPHGRIARNTLATAGVPAYCVERGWLPRTFQLHATENNGYNDFFTSFALNRSLPAVVREYGARAEPFDSAQRYYLEQGIQKYDAGARLDIAALRSKYGLGDAKLVVVFCASAGSSVGPHDTPSMAYTSPYFENISDALALLADLLAPYPDVRVLVQEHPIQRAIGKSATLPPGFVATMGENIHTLLHGADRVAFIGSTTVQAEALMLDTPRLSMSRHPASHTGASYGLVEEGADAVAAWMGDTRASETRVAARALVNYLCSEQLIRDEVLPDFVQRSTDDLADFIAGLSRPSRSSVDARLEQFFAQAQAMLKERVH